MQGDASVFGLFFFNDAAPTEIYTLSLHDALPISPSTMPNRVRSAFRCGQRRCTTQSPSVTDRKSTRLNSSHSSISYAVFCLKKKNDTPLLVCTLDHDARHPRLHPLLLPALTALAA